MSSNKSNSKNKHYSQLEKQVLLQLLEKRRHIIEIKKSDGNTIKQKEAAWTDICNRYNECSVVGQEVKIMIICNFFFFIIVHYII